MKQFFYKPAAVGLLIALLFCFAACKGQPDTPSPVSGGDGPSDTSGRVRTTGEGGSTMSAIASSDAVSQTPGTSQTGSKPAAPGVTGTGKASQNRPGTAGSNKASQNRPVTTSSSRASQSQAGAKPTDSAFNPDAVKVLPYASYNLDAFMTPYWQGHVVYNESVMFVKNADGSLEAAPLMFDPVKILSVRNFGLDKEYKEGVDYTIENGRIKLTAKSGIYAWPYHYLYPQSLQAAQKIFGAGAQVFGKTGGGNLYYAENDTFFKTQIAVTYIHDSKWTGAVPQYAGTQLSGSIAKLKAKQNLTIVFYGDSTSTGCNSSGWSSINKAPHCPTFPDMVTAKLKQQYGTNAITVFNESVGGMTTQWGAENVPRVTAHHPDLVILSWGHNNPGDSADYVKAEMKKILSACRAKNPAVEFILITPYNHNPEAAGFEGNLAGFAPAFEALSAEMGKAAVAPVRGISEYMLQRKRWYDFSGNNVNHVNDFFNRAVAMAVCGLMMP